LVVASRGYRRVSVEEQGALLEIVLRVGTTPRSDRLGSRAT
jgi:hypothetical protein